MVENGCACPWWVAELTDSHCHLNHEKLYADLPHVLRRAREAGVHRVVAIGYDLASSERALAIAGQHSDVWCAVGVHPHDAATYTSEVEASLRRMAKDERVVAIGEIGLDYHYDFAPRAIQLEAFVAQLHLAAELGLPVVIHCREAHADTLGAVRAAGCSISGVMHCWSGSVSEAKRAVESGLYIGIAGVVTFKKPGDLPAVVRAVPRDRLVIETDAPYLSPTPMRGRVNEPAFLRWTAAEVARLLDMSAADLAALTDANAAELYPRLRLAAEG